jgi:hypothetical protein
MGLDIRIPIGALFTLLGVFLSGYGLLSDKAIYARSLNLNINLAWGLVMIAFGALMLIFGGRRASSEIKVG